MTVSLPGASSDQIIPSDAIDDQLGELDRGVYKHYGERLEVHLLGSVLLGRLTETIGR